MFAYTFVSQLQARGVLAAAGSRFDGDTCGLARRLLPIAKKASGHFVKALGSTKTIPTIYEAVTPFHFPFHPPPCPLAIDSPCDHEMDTARLEAFGVSMQETALHGFAAHTDQGVQDSDLSASYLQG